MRHVQHISGMDIHRRKCQMNNRQHSLLMILLERAIHSCLKETLYIRRKCNCLKDVIPLDERIDENNKSVLKMG